MPRLPPLLPPRADAAVEAGSAAGQPRNWLPFFACTGRGAAKRGQPPLSPRAKRRRGEGQTGRRRERSERRKDGRRLRSGAEHKAAMTAAAGDRPGLATPPLVRPEAGHVGSGRGSRATERRERCCTQHNSDRSGDRRRAWQSSGHPSRGSGEHGREWSGPQSTTAFIDVRLMKIDCTAATIDMSCDENERRFANARRSRSRSRR